MDRMTLSDLPRDWVVAVSGYTSDNDGSLILRALREVNRMATAHRLDLGSPYTGGALSLCLPVWNGRGDRLVLKVLIDPSHAGEVAALEHWNKHQILLFPSILATGDNAYLMSHHYSDGALDLGALNDSLARMATTPHPSPGQFPPLSTNVELRISWAVERFLDDRVTPFPHWLDRAAGELRELAGSDHRNLVHGDLQRKNVLTPDAGPILIDPMPVVGDSMYDRALFIATGNHPDGWEQTFTELARPVHPLMRPRLERWVTALAVIESRPANDTDLAERTDFISSRWGLPTDSPKV